MKNLLLATSHIGRLSLNKYSNNIKKVIFSPFSSHGKNHSSHSGISPKLVSSEIRPMFQFKCLQHRFKNWPDLRKHKLTASTFAQAVGFWPHRRTQLWLEKIGHIEPFAGNEATCWNNIKEEEALERYKLLTENDVSLPKFEVYGKPNCDDNWLAASPDGIINKFYGLSYDGILEIKCPYFDGEKSKATPWKRIPIYYIPQAQGLMEILDREWMDLYVWTLNGSSLFRLYRDKKYWDLLNVALCDFWWKHVHPAKEKYEKGKIMEPLIELESFRPAPKHKFFRYILHESKCVVDNSDLLIREVHGKLQN